MKTRYTKTRLYKKDLTEHMLTVGAFLKQKRMEGGWTQALLAKKTGIGAHMNIARYENGLARVPLENIEPLADALKVDPVDLAKKVFKSYGLDFLIERIQ